MAGENYGTVSSGYRSAMDGKAHEGTYSAFTHFTMVGTVAVCSIVGSLGVGGAKHAWFSCLFLIILTLITTPIGLFSPRIAWRAPAVPFVLSLLMLLLY